MLFRSAGSPDVSCDAKRDRLMITKRDETGVVVTLVGFRFDFDRSPAKQRIRSLGALLTVSVFELSVIARQLSTTVHEEVSM